MTFSILSPFLITLCTVLLVCGLKPTVDLSQNNLSCDTLKTKMYDAGSFYNTEQSEIKVTIKNTFNVDLIIDKVVRLNNNTHFSPPYFHEIDFPIKQEENLYFKKTYATEDIGARTDSFAALLLKPVGDTILIPIPINISYTLLRNQSFLRGDNLEDIDIQIGAYRDTIIEIENTADEKVTINQIKPDKGITLKTKTQFVLLPGEQKKIPVRIERNGENGCYKKEIFFETDEPILSKGFTYYLSGGIIGKDQPILQFDSTRQTRYFTSGDEGVYEFHYTNVGNKTLIISTVKSSCGCLAPYFDQKPVEPGKGGVIYGRYDTRRIGVINKSMTVQHNGSCKATYLRVSGEVYPNKK